MFNIPQVLTIAGSDSGGGAGIQADLKTFQMRSVFGTSVITAITAQNTMGVTDVEMLDCHIISAQIQAIAADFNIKALKTGMLGNSEIIHCIAQHIQRHCFGQLILDPVMVAKNGASLLENNAVTALQEKLIPLANIITPNIPEAEVLCNITIHNDTQLKKAAQMLQKMGAKTVIIKGGHQHHSTSKECTDWIFTPTEHFNISTPRIHTPHTHGTGCTFSACLTAELAKGIPLKQAVSTAKHFITVAIQHSLNIGKGHGPTNHWAYRTTNQ